MKKIILIALFLVISNSVVAQQEISTYKVSRYLMNGDEQAINSDVALSFYMCDKKTLCFMNQWRKKGSKSYGKYMT
jgi:hypothetical protein